MDYKRMDADRRTETGKHREARKGDWTGKEAVVRKMRKEGVEALPD